MKCLFVLFHLFRETMRRIPTFGLLTFCKDGSAGKPAVPATILMSAIYTLKQGVYLPHYR